MRVLHVVESALGGTGTYINEIVPFQQGVFGSDHVAVLIPQEHKSQMSDRSLCSLRYFRRPGRKTGLIFLVVAYCLEMRRFKPDLVHAHSTFAGLVARVLAPFFGVPIVYCPHGWATEMQQSSIRRTLIGWVERFLSKLCSIIVAVSEYEKKRGLELGIPAHKLVTILNGIDAEIPPVAPVEWNDNRLKVLFVGRLDQQKGIDVLLDAVEHLQDSHSLHVVGAAVAGKEAVDFRRVPHAVAYGWQNSAEVAAHIASCDVIVIPSRWEGFGLVAVEAMRLAKPVIAASVGGLTEIVVDKETGYLFPSGDVASLRSILLEIDKDSLCKMGLAGKVRFLEKFTSARMNAEVLSLYQTLPVPTPNLGQH